VREEKYEREEKQNNNSMTKWDDEKQQKRGDSVQIKENPMSQPRKRMIQPRYL